MKKITKESIKTFLKKFWIELGKWGSAAAWARNGSPKNRYGR
jgi:hypothetical protein